MLTTALLGAPYTPGSTTVLPSSQPTPSPASQEPSPSPSRTDDITLSGSDTRSASDELPWGGLAIILLCGFAGLFGYSVARRGGPGTTGHV
jgi:hypothetical protein